MLGFAMHTAALACIAALFMARSYFGDEQISPTAFTLMLCVGKVSQSMHAGGYFANYFDLTREYAGALTGVGNTLATTAGLVFPMLASGYVDSDVGWLHLLAIVAGMNLLAIAAVSSKLLVDSLDVDAG